VGQRSIAFLLLLVNLKCIYIPLATMSGQQSLPVLGGRMTIHWLFTVNPRVTMTYSVPRTGGPRGTEVRYEGTSFHRAGNLSATAPYPEQSRQMQPSGRVRACVRAVTAATELTPRNHY
jgi:hypothetical protein